MEVITILIAVVGGFVAGIINTLAGNGSAITLSILTEVLGLPGNLANGTNRVGIFFQSAASGTAFYRNDKLDLYRSKSILILTCAGAIIGVLVATRVSNEFFISVYKFFMVIMLIVILVKPKRWLRETDLDNQIPLWLKAPIFLALGFYGGFIQMGMGVFFLAIIVLVGKYSIIDGNALKVFVIAIYTGIALLLFQFHGLVSWKYGAIIAIGQTAGGYLTAKYASRFKKADVWAYRLLVAIVITVVLRQFGFFELF